MLTPLHTNPSHFSVLGVGPHYYKHMPFVVTAQTASPLTDGRDNLLVHQASYTRAPDIPGHMQKPPPAPSINVVCISFLKSIQPAQVL